MAEVIGNPLTWAVRVLGRGAHHVGEGAGEFVGEDTAPIEIRDLRTSDLRLALRRGVDDFMALRTDVMFIVVIYPLIGVLLTWFALHSALLPLIFPMIAGFALLGPVAAIGLYEMSRRRELGLPTGWGDAFNIMTSPSFVPIVVLGVYLAAIFLVWMLAAYVLYNLTLGPAPPSSIPAFVQDVFTTGAGWAMMIAGVAIGFCFAALVLAISLVSFPLLVDRHVGVLNAVITSVRISLRSPVSVAQWGAIVVVLLGVGVVTLFIGLIFVLPVLGHATWHLYRQAVVSPVRPKTP
ncbi:DUF2189 domain-containing protein [Pikeienuella piscinae]|uniref:DUF2189 domain-containing protein n=1 Tax=Pikeienuella piscinae TaxID=2748098 RepID=A0A7L5BZR3_9RHOB|nr:DUF2189 domain-containing protein [Pikeienuella piscinae]QIE56328.1 DUF2189 domain-containing protein [Pikeienuella piscinae]